MQFCDVRFIRMYKRVWRKACKCRQNIYNVYLYNIFGIRVIRVKQKLFESLVEKKNTEIIVAIVDSLKRMKSNS